MKAKILFVNLFLFIIFPMQINGRMLSPTLDELIRSSSDIFIGKVLETYDRVEKNDPYLVSYANIEIIRKIKMLTGKSMIEVAYFPYNEHQPKLKKEDIRLFFVKKYQGRIVVSWPNTGAMVIKKDLVYPPQLKDFESPQKLEEFIEIIKKFIQNEK